MAIITGRNGDLKFSTTAGEITYPSATYSAYATGTAYTTGAVVTNNGHYYEAKVDIATGDNTGATILADTLKFTDLGTNAPATIPTITAPTSGTINPVKNMGSWKIDTDIDVKEAAVFRMCGWKKKYAGLQSWSGSADGFFDKSDDKGQEALRTAALAGTSVYVEFYMDAVNKYAGNVIIKKISIDTNSDDFVKFSVDFEGDGALC